VRLSIVIPTHDTCEMTLQCVASVEAARRADDEVILIDDGLDGTADVVGRRHPGVHVRRHERTMGFTRSANEGLGCATGDLLLVLNSDTIVDPDALEAIRTACEKDPGLGVVSPRLVGHEGGPQWIGGRAPTLAWLFALSTGLGAALRRWPVYGRVRDAIAAGPEWVTGAAMVIRRPVWDAIGPFDAGFRFYAQDLEFCLRARDAGWRIGIVSGARVVHVGGATVERLPGALGSSNPAWLWADLLRWAEKRRGADWARRAAGLMWAGSSARLWGRALARVAVPRRRRARWDQDSETLRAARRAIGSSRR
jgi:N-acetylglucosaminyl-diphospho-decaprenol L-rhamnosyltransferase